MNLNPSPCELPPDITPFFQFQSIVGEFEQERIDTEEFQAFRDITKCCVRGEVEKGGVLWDKVICPTPIPGSTPPCERVPLTGPLCQPPRTGTTDTAASFWCGLWRVASRRRRRADARFAKYAARGCCWPSGK